MNIISHITIRAIIFQIKTEKKMNNKDSNERLSFWAMNDDGTNVKFDILFSFETNL